MPDPHSYQAVGWILVALAALCAGVNQIHSFLDRMKDKPAPADVKQHATDTFATKDQLEKVEELFQEVIRDGDERRRAIYAKMEAHKEQLSHELHAVSNKLAAVDTMNTALVQRLSSIEGKLDRAIERGAPHRGRHD